MKKKVFRGSLKIRVYYIVCIILSYRTFGIANLIALRLNNIASAMDRIDNAIAVMNMRLYDSVEGKY